MAGWGTGVLTELKPTSSSSGLRDAALELQQHFRPGAPPKAPIAPQEAPRAPSEGFQGPDYLEHEHEAVQALGIPVDVAEALGIGWAKRGTMLKRVLIPLRSPSGKLGGYIGIAPGTDVKLPSKYHL